MLNVSALGNVSIESSCGMAYVIPDLRRAFRYIPQGKNNSVFHSCLGSCFLAISCMFFVPQKTENNPFVVISLSHIYYGPNR